MKILMYAVCLFHWLIRLSRFGDQNTVRCFNADGLSFHIEQPLFIIHRKETNLVGLMIQDNHCFLIRENCHVFGIFAADGKNTDFTEQTCLLINPEYTCRVGASCGAVQILAAWCNAQTGGGTSNLIFVLADAHFLNLLKLCLTVAVVIGVYQHFIGKLTVYIGKTSISAETDQPWS